jgi:hypothetical protein
VNTVFSVHVELVDTPFQDQRSIVSKGVDMLIDQERIHRSRHDHDDPFFELWRFVYTSSIAI